MHPFDRALAVLGSQGQALGIQPAGLYPRRAYPTPGGNHVTFQQVLDGLPVFGARVTVHLDSPGDALPVTSIYEPHLHPLPVAAGLSREEALAIACGVAGDELRGGGPSTQLGVLPTVDGGERVWRIVLPLAAPAADLRLDISAQTGAVLSRRDLLQRTGQAQVFWPNPLKTSDDPHLWLQVLQAGERVTSGQTVPVRFPLALPDGEYQLSGPAVEVVDVHAPHLSPPRRADLNFAFPVANPYFSDAMAYFWTDGTFRYLAELGFGGLLQRRLQVDAHDASAGSNYYSPHFHRIGLLPASQDRPAGAHDATIIVHEAGHAVLESQVPDFGDAPAAAALAEGFADALAALFFAPYVVPERAATVGDWARPPEGVRRVDLPLSYPADLVGDAHKDGRIWSGALWQLFAQLGGTSGTQTERARVRDAVLRTAVESHFFLYPTAGFAEAGAALLAADRALTGGSLGPAIEAALAEHGIPWPAASFRTALT